MSPFVPLIMTLKNVSYIMAGQDIKKFITKSINKKIQKVVDIYLDI